VTNQHNPNLKLDFPTDTSDVYNPVWLALSLLQAVEVQTEPVAGDGGKITAKIRYSVEQKYGRS